MSYLKRLMPVACWLTIVGAVNWGLAAFNFDLINRIFGPGSISTVLYVAVGLSGVVCLIDKLTCCGSGSCGTKGDSSKGGCCGSMKK